MVDSIVLQHEKVSDEFSTILERFDDFRAAVGRMQSPGCSQPDAPAHTHSPVDVDSHCNIRAADGDTTPLAHIHADSGSDAHCDSDTRPDPPHAADVDAAPAQYYV